MAENKENFAERLLKSHRTYGNWNTQYTFGNANIFQPQKPMKCFKNI